MNKKDPSDTHTRWLHTRLTDSEMRSFDALVRGLQTTRAEFLRKVAREAAGAGPELLQEEMKTFREAIYQVGAIGRNFNQLVRGLNSGVQPDPVQLRATLEEIRNTLARLEQQWSLILLRSRTKWMPHEHRPAA